MAKAFQFRLCTKGSVCKIQQRLIRPSSQAEKYNLQNTAFPSDAFLGTDREGKKKPNCFQEKNAVSYNPPPLCPSFKRRRALNWCNGFSLSEFLNLPPPPPPPTFTVQRTRNRRHFSWQHNRLTTPHQVCFFLYQSGFPCMCQGCQVDLCEAKKNKFGLFLIGWPQNFF